ncbi:VCBS repeat-containing protein [Isoptericola sp. b515]|uniref:FG-GAP repeat domain-containing protein n=1 Tax=Isoptericola sp. b515 TaxID=3064652 RepID=UPI002713075D|nr:VCBS repeat-containing protein [Isoptericola sp. b515]MDO8147755.1 VCBS repeat-containing protein [Isoptericola sp. b515]
MSSLKLLAAPVAALALAGLAWLPWQPGPPAEAAERAVERISFATHDLPDSDGNQQQRPVAPDLEHIRPWISAVGASVGSMDLRGLGRPGDACLTDPRDDRLRVFPVPGSGGPDFEPFELHPDGLRYDRTMAPIGCVPTDIDQDGRQDVVAYYWGRSPVIFRNTGPGTGTPSADWFTAAELVEPMQVWNSTALNIADIDGDGLLDIAVGNYFPDGSRVLDETADDDPRMQMQHSMGDAHNAGVNRLYLGGGTEADGGLRFTDVSERWPEESADSWTLALGPQDLTGNGLPDLYVANDFGPDQLLVNTSEPGDVRLTEVRGDRDLTTARSKVMGHDSFKGMGVAYSYAPGADLPSIHVSNITTTWGLQEGNFAFYPTGRGEELLEGSFPFEDRAAEVNLAVSGWSWDIKPIDPTNSGREGFVQATGMIAGTEELWPRLQEMAMGNDQILSSPTSWMRIGQDGDISGDEPNRLWIPVGDQFVDAGSRVPFDESTPSRGFSVADVDGDGLQDVLVANQWARSQVHLNTSTPENPSVTLAVTRQGEHGPTPVIGAVVTVEGPGYSRTSQLYPANGHSGVSGSQLHFALPADALADATATVRWVDADGQHSTTFALIEGAQELRIDR